MASKDFLYCELTDTKIYSNDVVSISSYPSVRFIAKRGWYKVGTAQVNGWYFINIADKTIIPIDQIDINTVTKSVAQGTSELRPTLKDVDTIPAEVNFIVIPGTNIRLYDSDIVKISNKPQSKWIVHSGWYIYNGVQNFGWYFECIHNGEIYPVSLIDLTLVTLVTAKTQGSERYDGKVVNYTRPFTLADAEILNRTFITVDTIEQRDNIDQNTLINGKLVRVNDVSGEAEYYCWDSDQKVWIDAEFGGSAIPELVGTAESPIILSDLPSGLYRVIGAYKITSNTETVATDIDHLTFVSGINPITVKVITESSIKDYNIVDGKITFSNEYTTKEYVDGQITILEQQISELISEIPSMIDERISEIFEPIPDSFIRSLFIV